VRILGTGSALPALAVTNDDLAKFLDTSDEWIRTRTGIGERRVITTESSLSLAMEAALRALENAHLAAHNLDMIIVSASQGEAITPSTASMLQGAIGASCPAFDINGACSGFIYALDVADAYIRSGKARTILVLCAETLSRMCDWTDRATCVLFGDGAGAAIVGEGDGLIAAKIGTYSNVDVLNAFPNPGNSPFQKEKRPASPLYMAGHDVYKFAVSTSSADLRALAEQTGTALDDISHFILHQANMRIVEAVRTRLKQPKEKFAHNIERTGNTSSASVPILLDEVNRSGALKTGDLVALSAFGAGLTSGAALLRWTL